MSDTTVVAIVGLTMVGLFIGLPAIMLCLLICYQYVSARIKDKIVVIPCAHGTNTDLDLTGLIVDV